jgi:hypothetical protein
VPALVSTCFLGERYPIPKLAEFAPRCPSARPI